MTPCLHRLAAATMLAWSCALASAEEMPVVPFADSSNIVQLQDEEKRIWDEANDGDKHLRRRGALRQDTRLQVYLQDLVDQLYPEFKGVFRISVVNDPLLNAFALPNGSLYINTGLLARLENEAQLAAVLGHEGAHFIHRHGYQQRQNLKGTAAFGLGIGVVGGAVGLLGQLAAVSSIYGYSRDHEREADRVGFARMSKLGYDTQQGIKVFEILREEARVLDHKEAFMFASHPKLDERVQSYQELRKSEATSGDRKDEQRFLELTREIRMAWIEQAFAKSLYKSVIYVLEQPSAESRFPKHQAYYLGEAYRLRNEVDDRAKALKAYQQALQQAPDFAPTYKALGMLQLQEGKKAEARENLQRYLAMDPGAADALFIQSYIQQIQ